jgi:hypothetical protein
MKYIVEQKSFMYDVKHSSWRKCCRSFIGRILTVWCCVKQWLKDYNKIMFSRMLDKKDSWKRHVQTEEELDISAQLEAARRSHVFLALQCGLAKSRVMLVKLQPHKTTVTHSLLPPDYAKRIHYCKWFSVSVFKGLLHSEFTLSLFWPSVVHCKWLHKQPEWQILEHRKSSCCSISAVAWFKSRGFCVKLVHRG